MRLNPEELYFRDIKRYAVLSDEEERDLVARVQRNESGAINKLITANLRFVVSVARRYCGRGLNYMDLINEGNIGLYKAAKKFNLSLNVKFISYAVWWIRQSIQKAFFEQSNMVRIPLNKITLFRNFKTALDKNQGDYYETIMMENFKKYETDIVEIMEKVRSISLDAPIDVSRKSGEDGDKTFKDVLGEEPNQENESEQKELSSLLDTLLQNVSSREERIIRMSFGLNFSKQFTLDEIGKALNISHERVRHIRDKTLQKLFRNNKIRERLVPFMKNCE